MYKLDNVPPAPTDFIKLRQLVGWDNCSLDITRCSIDNSLFWVTCYHQDVLIGVGRVVGDGAMYFYIQDVIVAPEHQANGLGAQLMTAIEEYLQRHASKHATVGLFAAQGKEGFYQKYGYLLRDGTKLGMGMCRFVKE